MLSVDTREFIKYNELSFNLLDTDTSSSQYVEG